MRRPWKLKQGKWSIRWRSEIQLSASITKTSCSRGTRSMKCLNKSTTILMKLLRFIQEALTVLFLKITLIIILSGSSGTSHMTSFTERARMGNQRSLTTRISVSSGSGSGRRKSLTIVQCLSSIKIMSQTQLKLTRCSLCKTLKVNPSLLSLIMTSTINLVVAKCHS